MNLVPGFLPFYDYFRYTEDSDIIDSGQTDYSSGAMFQCHPANSAHTVAITQIRCALEHIASDEMEFWGIGDPLTIGLRLYLKKGTDIIFDLTGGLALTSAHEMLSIMDKVTHVEFAGAHDGKLLTINFDSYGQPLLLSGAHGHYLELVLADNFTKLTSMIWSAQGYITNLRYIS